MKPIIGIVGRTNRIKVSAESEDGLIEAIEFPNNKFALGVQWHPEDLFDTDENMFKIFRAFITISEK